MICLACGSANLVEGEVNWSGAENIKFKPSQGPLLLRIFGVGSRKIRGYGCIHCGHLQLGVVFTQKDREQFQKFEGQQPSVVKVESAESDEP